MFNLFSRPGRHPRRIGDSRLGCERLERRDCPAAPTVLWMSVTRLEGHDVRVAGQVGDESPAACNLQLSGAATGRIAVNPDGTFSTNLTPNGFGQISARAFDVDGNLSAPRMQDYQNVAPIVEIQSERVADEVAASSSILGGGVAAESVLPGAEDDFSAILTSAGDVGGDVIDSSGLATRIQGDRLDNAPPQITNYSAMYQNGMWVVFGNVIDEYAPGLTVTFHSAISTVNNRTATVGSDGSFSFSFALPPGSLGGIVSATTVDWYGARSNEPMVYVG